MMCRFHACCTLSSPGAIPFPLMNPFIPSAALRVLNNGRICFAPRAPSPLPFAFPLPPPPHITVPCRGPPLPNTPRNPKPHRLISLRAKQREHRHQSPPSFQPVIALYPLLTHPAIPHDPGPLNQVSFTALARHTSKAAIFPLHTRTGTSPPSAHVGPPA